MLVYSVLQCPSMLDKRMFFFLTQNNYLYIFAMKLKR
jgi:hypothetical protein